LKNVTDNFIFYSLVIQVNKSNYRTAEIQDHTRETKSKGLKTQSLVWH